MIMRRFHNAPGLLAAAAAVLALGGTALADEPGRKDSGEQRQQGQKEQQKGVRGQEGQRAMGQPQQQAQPKGLGAGVGEGCTCGPSDVMAPLESGLGAGVGPGAPSEKAPSENVEPGGEAGKTHAPATKAPSPQYWIADTSLFIANAANAAQTLSNEQAIGTPAASVLGNHAQFLLESIERAAASISALESHAQLSNPRAAAELRSAIDQLTLAKGEAQQVLDAANSGQVGGTQEQMIHSTYDHLQAAERGVGAVARSFGLQRVALPSTCGFRAGAGYGAGIGGKAAPGAGQPKGPAMPQGQPPPSAPQEAPKP
jgi:hypothetical protein